jgi:COP9 signalosome complex subunit 7
LSLLPLSSRPEQLTYDNLRKTLDLNSSRELENLVIQAIYAGLLSGKLSPAQQRVEISSSTSRDLAPNAVHDVAQSLNTWDQRCEATLGTIERQIADVKARATARAQAAKAHDAEVRKTTRTLPSGGVDAEGRAIRGPLASEGGGRGAGLASRMMGKKAGKRLIADEDDEDLDVGDSAFGELEDEGLDEMEVDPDDGTTGFGSGGAISKGAGGRRMKRGGIRGVRRGN